MRKKKSQGGILTLVLIILIILASIILVWTVIKNAIGKGSDVDTEIITVSLTIEEPVYVNYTVNLTRFGVTRGTDKAVVDHLAISVVGIDDTGKTLSLNFNVSAPSQLETKYYTLNFTRLAKLSKIVLYPVSIKGRVGISTTYTVRNNEAGTPPDWGPPINPVCDSSGIWQNQGCFEAGCGIGGNAGKPRYQTRTVDPAGCAAASQCVNDTSCTCTTGVWSDNGCGNGCAAIEMNQTRTVSPAGCAAASQCNASHPTCAMTYYLDSDRDGFGNGTISLIRLANYNTSAELSGHINDDCNDSYSLAHPGAVEILDNRIDEDCDWRDTSGVNSCKNLNSNSVVYLLTQSINNVPVDQGCFNITANKVILDLNGFLINGTVNYSQSCRDNYPSDSEMCNYANSGSCSTPQKCMYTSGGSSCTSYGYEYYCYSNNCRWNYQPSNDYYCSGSAPSSCNYLYSESDCQMWGCSPSYSCSGSLECYFYSNDYNACSSHTQCSASTSYNHGCSDGSSQTQYDCQNNGGTWDMYCYDYGSCNYLSYDGISCKDSNYNVYSACYPYYGSCEGSVSRNCGDFSSSNCSSQGSYCSWVPVLNGSCTYLCENWLNPSDCFREGCEWHDDYHYCGYSSVVNCGNYHNGKECYDNRCYWDYNGGYCNSFGEGTYCAAQPQSSCSGDCSWRNLCSWNSNTRVSSFGIHLKSYNNAFIRNGKISNFNYGISIENSTNNLINGVNITGHRDVVGTQQGFGVTLVSSSNNNTISNVAASRDHYYGIYMFLSSGNRLANITANLNYYGVWLASSSNNNVTNLNSSQNAYTGTYISSSNSNSIINSTACSNSLYDFVCSSSTSAFNSNKCLQSKSGTCSGLTCNIC
jgi:parallel beta-helix repeat protein